MCSRGGQCSSGVCNSGRCAPMANNGDGVLDKDGLGTGEDFPSVEQV